MRRRNLLLAPFCGARHYFLSLAIIGTPAPRNRYHVASAARTVDLRADRAWVFVPGQCVTVSWNLEGIQSLYIDGSGTIGWGEESFCPSLEATSPVFEFTAANGEIRDFRLGIHYLPADVIHSLALMALLAPFVVAIYYVAFPRLEQPIPLNMSSVLLLLALLLLFLLIQTVRTFSIESVLSGLGDIFASPAWQVFGLVLAGLVFIPLAIQETWKGLQRRAWADFIVIAAFMIFVLLLYLPFGFNSVGHWEEWVSRAYLETKPSVDGSELVSRFWIYVPYVLANLISHGSFLGYHLVNVLMFSAKLVFLYGILRRLNVTAYFAFLIAILFAVFPVNIRLMSLRSFNLTFGSLALLVAVFLILDFIRRPSRLRLLGAWLALLFCIGSYESGYAVVAVLPLLWWWRNPKWSWRNMNLTIIWFLFPFAKVLFLLLLSVADVKYYGIDMVDVVLESELLTLGSPTYYLNIIRDVFIQTFWFGWREALAGVRQNIWILPSIGALAFVGAISAYLAVVKGPHVFPSRRQIGFSVLTGLLFIIPSIGVLMWLEKYNRDLWRMYIYVPIGAAIALFYLILLITDPVKMARLRHSLTLGLCLLIIFPALCRLFTQHAYYVSSANNKASVLYQAVQQAPAIDSNARVILLTGMLGTELRTKKISEFRTNMVNGAYQLLYDGNGPEFAFLCIIDKRCFVDDRALPGFQQLSKDLDYSNVVLLFVHDDLSVELLRELPPELDDGQNHTYDPEPLIDTSAPIPPRALTMLASARRN